MNNMRRKICQTLGGLLGLHGLAACAQTVGQTTERVYSEEEQKRMHKFRGVSGAEWYSSAIHELRYVEMRDESGRVVEGAASVVPGSSTKFALAAIPVRLKVIWKEIDPEHPIVFRGSNNPSGIWSGGKIVATYEIPVADRIPDELLDDLRRDRKGGLRIKVRLHREGVLLGWDIERRPNPWGLTRDDIRKRNIFIAPAWSHTGGDFKEARAAFYSWEGDRLEGLPTNLPQWHKGIPGGEQLWRWQGFVALPTAEQLGHAVPQKWAEQGLYITSANDPCCDQRVKGALWEKGWYIDPKTKKRIETFF